MIYITYLPNGLHIVHESLGDVKTMVSPVMCNHCNKIYDLRFVKVTHRYQDCTQFKTPCCELEVDDRRWKSRRDYEDVIPSELY